MCFLTYGSLDGSVVLLNISPYVPNQIALAVVTGLMSAALFGYSVTHRYSAFWSSFEIKAACILDGLIALFMACFIMVGYATPLAQPVIHLFSEAAILATFSIICLHVSGIGQRKQGALEVVVSRPKISLMFKLSPYVMGAGLAVSAVVAFVDPFPMNNIHTDASLSNFVYRAAYLIPGAIFTSMIFLAYSATFISAVRRYGFDEPSGYVARVGWYVPATFTLVALAALHSTITYLQAFNVAVLSKDSPVFWILMATDIMLYAAMCVTWLKALAVEYSKSPSQREMENSMEYRFLRLHLQQCLDKIGEEALGYTMQLELADKISSTLGFEHWRKAQTRSLINSLALANGVGIYEPEIMRQKMKLLYNKQQELVKSSLLAEDSRSKSTLQEDHLSESIPVSLGVVRSDEEMNDLCEEHQVALIVAADWGLYDDSSNQLIMEGGIVNTEVRAAYRLHKAEGNT